MSVPADTPTPAPAAGAGGGPDGLAAAVPIIGGVLLGAGVIGLIYKMYTSDSSSSSSPPPAPVEPPPEEKATSEAAPTPPSEPEKVDLVPKKDEEGGVCPQSRKKPKPPCRSRRRTCPAQVDPADEPVI